MPPPLTPIERRYQAPDRQPELSRWVRGVLAGMALGLITVFCLAIWIRPYDDEGRPKRMETHLQLGLPPCHFRYLTGVPCPSCGMTTSFSLLMHGDPVSSLKANAVGTCLAIYFLAMIPWCLASAIRGRSIFIVAVDRAVTWTVIAFLSLMLVRWAIVLCWGWLSGNGF